jgi:tRNA threonylcarbamoyladenosine biosynthesis protein TsaB
MMQSVALEEDGLLVDSSLHLQTEGHARGLADTVAQLLARRGWEPDSLHELIVGAGPGSFTGLRIGLSFAKGLAFSSGARIRNVPSIAAIAAVLPAGGRLVYATEARRNEVYGGVLSTGPLVEELVAVGAYPPATLAAAAGAFAEGGWLAGNGAGRYAEAFAHIVAETTRLEAGFDLPTAAGLLAYLRTHDVELVEPAMVEPAYVRPHGGEAQRAAALTAQSGPVDLA